MTILSRNIRRTFVFAVFSSELMVNEKKKDQHDLQMTRRKLIHGQEMYPEDSNLAKD